MNKSPEYEPRNRLLLCVNHYANFNNLRFFIRYQPATKQYIFFNFDALCPIFGQLHRFHGKAVALDSEDMDAPLPLLFLVHEYLVRARNFIQLPVALEVEAASGWQKWMVDEGVVDEKKDGSFKFKRAAPPSGPDSGGQIFNVETSPTIPSTSKCRPRTTTINPLAPPTADLINE